MSINLLAYLCVYAFTEMKVFMEVRGQLKEPCGFWDLICGGQAS